MAQVHQERILRGEKGIFINHLQSRADSDRCMVVVRVVMMVAGDVWTIVDPKERLPLRPISNSEL